MSRHEANGTLGGKWVAGGAEDGPHGRWVPDAPYPSTIGVTGAYHSVAGQPAAALQGTEVKPLTLLDFVDDRIRSIDAERIRLSMVREQLVASGVTMAVDDLRRLLG